MVLAPRRREIVTFLVCSTAIINFACVSLGQSNRLPSFLPNGGGPACALGSDLSQTSDRDMHESRGSRKTQEISSSKNIEMMETLSKRMSTVSRSRKRMFDAQRKKGGLMWFYKRDHLGSTYGPWCEEQIRKWKKLGIIDDTTLVKRENETDFVRYGLHSSTGNVPSKDLADLTAQSDSSKKIKNDETMEKTLEDQVASTRISMLQAADRLEYMKAHKLKETLDVLEAKLNQRKRTAAVEEEYGVNKHKIQLRNPEGALTDIWLPCTIEATYSEGRVDVSLLSGEILRQVNQAKVYPVSNLDVIRRIKIGPPDSAKPEILEAIAPLSHYPTVPDQAEDEEDSDAKGEIFEGYPGLDVEDNNMGIPKYDLSDGEDEMIEDKVLRPGLTVEVRTMENPFNEEAEMWYPGTVREVKRDGCIITRNLDPVLYPDNPPKFYPSRDIRFKESYAFESLDNDCPKGHTCDYYMGRFPREYDTYPECDTCGSQQTSRSIFYHCFECTWDCCEACWTKRMPDPGSFQLNAKDLESLHVEKSKQKAEDRLPLMARLGPNGVLASKELQNIVQDI